MGTVACGIWFLCRRIIPLSELALGLWNGEKFGFKFRPYHLQTGWLWASVWVSSSCSVGLLMSLPRRICDGRRSVLSWPRAVAELVSAAIRYSLARAPANIA